MEPSGISAWRWPSVIVLIAALGLVAFIYFIKTPERLVETAGKGALEVAKVLDEAAAKFRRGNITETFVASLPKLESERGGLLELAKVTATETFRSEIAAGKTVDDLLIEAFAVVREGAKRALGMRHFDVQMIGGMVLHEGQIAEMKTGEGKTLVSSLLNLP